MLFRNQRIILAAFLICTLGLLASCSDDDDGPANPSTPIPDDVLEIADNVFDLIGAVMDGSPPPFEGLSIEPENPPEDFVDGFVLSIICEDMEPEPPHGPVVNGTIDLTARVLSSGNQILIEGALVLSDQDGEPFMTVGIDGAATWSTGGPDDGEPDRITGTFTVDGTRYDLARIIAELEDEGGGDQPINAVPEMYRGAQLHCQMARLSGEGDEQWDDDHYMRFYISESGQYYLMRQGVAWDTPDEEIHLECEGTIDWHTDGGIQRLYFHDDEGQDDRLFDVVQYDSDHIILSTEWNPSEPWDFWFEVVRY